MVGVCMGHVVQNNGLGQIPPEDAEIFDVVAKHTNTIFLTQTMSERENINVISDISVSKV